MKWGMNFQTWNCQLFRGQFDAEGTTIAWLDMIMRPDIIIVSVAGDLETKVALGMGLRLCAFLSDDS